MLDVEIDSSLDDFISAKMNNSLCIEKFHELEFQAFVKQFQEENSNPVVVTKDQKKDYYTVLTLIN